MSDEMKRYLNIMESAISGRLDEGAESDDDSCDCKKWDCPVCFPEKVNEGDEFDSYKSVGDDSHLEEMLYEIEQAQETGLSVSPVKYNVSKLRDEMSEERIARIYEKVIGKKYMAEDELDVVNPDEEKTDDDWYPLPDEEESDDKEISDDDWYPLPEDEKHRFSPAGDTPDVDDSPELSDDEAEAYRQWLKQQQFNKKYSDKR